MGVTHLNSTIWRCLAGRHRQSQSVPDAHQSRPRHSGEARFRQMALQWRKGGERCRVAALRDCRKNSSNQPRNAAFRSFKESVMRGGVIKIVVLVAGLIGMPAAVSAQASITGVVKDTSGAVLPGVTVEA